LLPFLFFCCSTGAEATAGEIVTVGAPSGADVAAAADGSDSFSFMPEFSKMVVFGVAGDRLKLSESGFPEAAAAASAASLVGELMFFSFIRLKIFTFRSPVLAAVVTVKR
jgi:hypothetical protein